MPAARGAVRRAGAASGARARGFPLVCRATDKPAPAKKAPAKKPVKKKKEPEVWAGPPTLDPNTPSPIFGGSTGGLLRKAQVEEFYVLTWESKKEQIFEMPTGGAAIMRQGPNLLKLARKEQCLSLLTQLRTKFKCDGCVYRVFPEKVNPGRVQVNGNQRSIGKNGQPIAVKF